MALSASQAIFSHRKKADSYVLASCRKLRLAISLSSNGQRLVLGDASYDGNAGSNSGRAKVFEWSDISSTWEQVHQTLHGEQANVFWGVAVALSADGSIVAIGAYEADQETGNVRVFYEHKASNFVATSWTQLGETLRGDKVDDYFGSRIALSSDGLTMAVAASHQYVRIFRYSENVGWKQLGQDLYKDHCSDYWWYPIDLSHDGDMVVVSSDCPGVSIFGWNQAESSWERLGVDIDVGVNDFKSVSIAADGRTVAVGAVAGNVNGMYSGSVGVFVAA